MKHLAHPLFVALACGLGATTLSAAQKNSVPETTVRALAEAPLCFEANRGQVDNAVSFIARGQNCAVFISPTEASMLVSKSGKAQTVRLTLAGANSRAVASGINELAGHANYFIGSDSSQWRSGIPLFSRVRIEQVYPGVDVVYHADQSARLEYDFLLQPGADAKQISLNISGADKVRVDAKGNLVLKIGDEEILQHKPVIYQTINGTRKEIAGGYKLAGKNTATFWIADYDHTLPLVIDPTVTFVSYLAGKNGDHGWDIATDAFGNVYVCGDTLTPSLAMSEAGKAAQSTYRGTHGTSVVGDAFVAKFKPDTDNVLKLSYLTYLGGNGQDAALGIAADGAGNAYVTGFTDSPNFPTRNAVYKKISGQNNTSMGFYRSDAFVTEISSNGTSLVYSTYLGGWERDCGNAIAVDDEGHAYVAGFTESQILFPVIKDRAHGANRVVQSAFGGSRDGFITKMGIEGTNVVFSTYLGGSGQDSVQGIAVDATGDVYVTGYTVSPNFPVVGAKNSHLNGLTTTTAAYDAFFTKISANGATNIFSTYLGGFNTDVGMRIAVYTNSAFLTGYTYSTNFPTTTNILEAQSYGGVSSDVFVTKFNPTNIITSKTTVVSGTTNVAYFTNSSYSREYSVKFGSKGPDQANGIAVDSLGEACIAGFTTRTNFFGTNNILVRKNFSSDDMFADFRPDKKISSSSKEAFVALLSPDGSKFQYAALFGGTGSDSAQGVALDSAANAYVVGGTTSVDFPTTNSIESRPGGKSTKSDVFVIKLSLQPFQEVPPPVETSVSDLAR